MKKFFELELVKVLEKNFKTRRRMYERIKKIKTLKRDLFYKIGDKYHYGFGDKENISASIYWYEKAIELGHDEATFELLQVYYHNEELPINDKLPVYLKKAEKYFEESYDLLREDDAMEMNYIFAEMYHYGENGVKKNMAKAVEYYEQLIVMGNLYFDDYEYCVITLAKIYLVGEGVPKNIERAITLLEGLSFEYYTTTSGNFYEDGQVVPMDYDESSYFFSFPENYGSEKAKYILGCMYLYGQGVKKNINKAAWWFAHIDELHLYDEGDIFKLAEAYRKGEGVKKDVENAIAWYEWLIEHKGDYSGEVACILGEIYYNGDGVEKDIYTAVEYFEKAAEAGNEKAMARLWKIEHCGEN